MHENNILNHLMALTHQPFLIFANQLEEKTDNALETLRLLAKEEQVTAGRISEYLDIKPSSVTQIIKKMEESGTITKVKSQEDARVTFVKITEKGRESLAYRGTISTNLKDELFKDFTEDELAQLDEYLARMTATISSEAFYEKIKELFGDDKRWNRFDKMSRHFGRAREQMLDRRGFDEFRGGFDGWKRGHKQ